MRRTFFLSLVILTALAYASGRELKVAKFEANPIDMTAATQQCIDPATGVPCALVRIGLPVSGVKVKGDVVGNPEFNGCEYLVYVPYNGQTLQIECPEYGKLNVNFRDYKYDNLYSKVVYNLSVEDADRATDGEYVTFKVPDVDHILICIDDQYHYVNSKDGEFSLFLSYGEHKYEVERQYLSSPYSDAKGSFSVKPSVENIITLHTSKLEGNLTINLAEKDRDAKVELMYEDRNLITGQDAKEKTDLLSKNQYSILIYDEPKIERTHFPGKKKLQVTKPGFEPYIQEFELKNQESLEINVPPLADARHTITVVCQPINARIKVDNVEMPFDDMTQNSEESTTSVTFPVAEGLHKIEISADWYKPCQLIVDGDKHPTQTIYCELPYDGVSTADKCVQNAIRKIEEFNNESEPDKRNEKLKDAQSYLQYAALLGNDWAKGMLGMLYYDYGAVFPHREYAAYWLECSNTQDALIYLSYIYRYGNGVEKDCAQALRYAKRAEAMGPNPKVYEALAWFYAKGEGVEQDMKEYMRLIKLGADQGDILSQIIYGVGNYFGYGGKPDYQEAKTWLHKALQTIASQTPDMENNFDAKFTNSALALLQFNGYGVEQNQEEAFKTWCKADLETDANALYGLGICYYEGIATTRNTDIGLQYLYKAAELEHEEACCYIGKLNEDLGNLAIAADYYEKAAPTFKEAKKGLNRVNKKLKKS